MNTKSQRGKLAEKYYSTCKKLQKSGILTSRYNKKRKLSLTTESTSTSTEITETERELNPDYEWLKENISPEEVVFDKWKSTHDLRRTHVMNSCIDIF